MGLEMAKRRQALDSVNERLATPTASSCSSRPTASITCTWARSLLPAGLQRKRRHLLPHQPLDHDRRALVGRGDRAFDYYLRINPSAREAISEVHRCEPYVYAQMIAGRDAPTTARPRTPG
jgi:cellobiose phosphorylase